jgi:alpha-amylase
MGVLLQGFFFAPGKISGVPSPLDGDQSIPFWWDHLASQAHAFRTAGFSAIWLPPPLKGKSGDLSSGYDPFDDYDPGSKDQKGTIPTRYGSREQLCRCVAVMRSNGIDVYVDMVENHRDGDDGHFNFKYLGASGTEMNGRFNKGPGDFHPHVPEDPGVFSDAFAFGRDLAPINGIPKDHCAGGLIDAADWLTRALGVQGYRLDDMKGVSTVFLIRLLNHGAMKNKFAFGEFADGNLSLVRSWTEAVQHRASAIDFPLHFMLKDMCNNPDGFDMSQLDHAGLAGADPQGAVTFVENHDTDRGGFGGPIVRNKLLAYAYVLTSEGYPAVFYRDYSKDKNCFGLNDSIDRLIWIHEKLAAGETTQRWKDNGLFVYERLGGRHLLVGLNKDSKGDRTVKVQSAFPPHTRLEDYAGHSDTVSTDGQKNVTITIPRNNNGTGFVCYSVSGLIPGPFDVKSVAVSQDYEGAEDLDIKPAIENERILVCRVFAKANTQITARLTIDSTHWLASTTAELSIEQPAGNIVGSGTLDLAALTNPELHVSAKATDFYSFFVHALNTPPLNKAPKYKLNITYTAPQTLPAAT